MSEKNRKEREESCRIALEGLALLTKIMEWRRDNLDATDDEVDAFLLTVLRPEDGVVEQLVLAQVYLREVRGALIQIIEPADEDVPDARVPDYPNPFAPPPSYWN